LLFQAKETRQAFAMCLDRQKMAAEIFFGRSQVPGAYLPPDHPLANPELRSYAYDPAAANALLESVGWKDLDGNPATPRVSQGVAGAPDGTPLIAPLLTTDDPEKQRVASWIKESLAQCGVQVDISAQAWDNLFAPGPGGPLFGRNFALAQFGWAAATQPPCYLYLTAEIPAPYPQAAKGWGGANPGGYSNPEFDQLCAQALHTLPDNPVHADSHRRAQAIFAEDLPAIPLYQRLKLAVARPDLCAVTLDASADSALWNIEAFNYGGPCAP
jgi:peptide/nickel transport system substrate-binding protein